MLHTALTRHFTTKSYDFVKYNGKVHANIVDFEARKDLYLFERIAKKRDPFIYLVGNMVATPRVWIRQYTDDNGTRAERYLGAKTYHFAEDLKQLKPVFADNFEGSQPYILDAWRSGQINIETIAIMELFGSITSVWAKNLPDTSQNRKDLLLISKYSTFFRSGDRDKYKALAREQFKHF